MINLVIKDRPRPATYSVAEISLEYAFDGKVRIYSNSMIILEICPDGIIRKTGSVDPELAGLPVKNGKVIVE